jgi:hypothetical protein
MEGEEIKSSFGCSRKPSDTDFEFRKGKKVK